MALFIGHIPLEIKREEIEDLFSPYGRITRCDLKRGYAFVEFEDKRDAQDAMDKEHNAKLGDVRIAVEWARGEGKRANSDECFKCHKPGHWARDCPENGGRGGDRDRDRRRSDFFALLP